MKVLVYREQFPVVYEMEQPESDRLRNGTKNEMTNAKGESARLLCHKQPLPLALLNPTAPLHDHADHSEETKGLHYRQ